MNQTFRDSIILKLASEENSTVLTALSQASDQVEK